MPTAICNTCLGKPTSFKPLKSMTQPINLREQFWAVELPDEVVHVEIYDKEDMPVAVMAYVEYPPFKPGLPTPIPISPGNWQLICTSKDVTEEQATTLVNRSQWYFPVKHTRYVDYAHPFDREFKQRWSEGFGTAIESLRSLLTSKSCDTDKNWAIIKKQ